MLQAMMAHLQALKKKREIVEVLLGKMNEVCNQAHVLSAALLTAASTDHEVINYLRDATPIVLRGLLVLIEANMSSLALQFESVNADIPKMEQAIVELEKGPSMIQVPGVVR